MPHRLWRAECPPREISQNLMTQSANLEFTYVYPFESRLETTKSGPRLRLATCGSRHEHPHFFEGALNQPGTVAQMLLVLSDVVRTHFFKPVPADLDPIVTSGGEMLRFEGFSGCCGVYARADLNPSAFQAEVRNTGTTNVDFNDPMRQALRRLQESDDARLAVGADEVVLSKPGQRVVEKKVKLPLRWIKGLSEVQAYQEGMVPLLEVDGSTARRFFRSLPRSGSPKQQQYAYLLGRALRYGPLKKAGSVPFMGTHRLKIVEPLVQQAKGMRVWANTGNRTSAWEIRRRPRRRREAAWRAESFASAQKRRFRTPRAAASRQDFRKRHLAGPCFHRARAVDALFAEAVAGTEAQEVQTSSPRRSLLLVHREADVRVGRPHTADG